MWIKLHLFRSSDEVLVQTQNICAVYPDQREQNKGAICIWFVGTEENDLYVKETVDEIGAMITE